jgi:Tfp pilus assembly protein PilV
VKSSIAAIFDPSVTIQEAEAEMIPETRTGRSGAVLRRGVPGIPGVDDKGVTLLEVVFAICILLVVALALTTLNAGTWKNTGSSKSYTEGSVLAAQHLEALFSRKYSSNTSSGMSAYVTAGDHTFQSSDGLYTVVYRIRDNDIMPDTKTVQMNVTFRRETGLHTIHYNYLLPIRK